MTTASLPRASPGMRLPETFWVQALSGTAATIWGAWVALYGSLDDLPAYDVLSRYVPDEAWCIIALTLGLAQVIAGLCSLRWPTRTRTARGVAAFVALLWWKVLAVSMINSGHAGPLPWVVCIIAIFNVPVIVHLIRRG